ncbi:uncharacterized protein LOC135925029 [Gordionus sp. m RMFG-2023]|uniref:uncharacterized protein LOC135925029 n=1 Tax=Gordionus sp. m RMFG-2023 TaxID=3053472 RepID=UPI0031FD33FD
MNLYEFNQKLKIEAKVEFQLNSNGSTIVICMLSLKSGRPYKCIQFRNTNITIFISDNLVSVKKKHANITIIDIYLNHIVYSLSWSLPRNNYYQYTFIGGNINISSILTNCI